MRGAIQASERTLEETYIQVVQIRQVAAVGMPIADIRTELQTLVTLSEIGNVLTAIDEYVEIERTFWFLDAATRWPGYGPG